MTLHRPELPITIGDPAGFAVKLDLDTNYGGEWLFGKIGYWIDGTPVGDYDLGTSLRDVMTASYYIFKDANTRYTERFVSKSKEELFNTVRSALYGIDINGNDVNVSRAIAKLAVEECWAKHNIRMNLDVFDNTRVFQFDEGSVSRIIWQSGSMIDSGIIQETRLLIGSTEAVFSSLHGVLGELIDWEESVRTL